MPAQSLPPRVLQDASHSNSNTEHPAVVASVHTGVNQIFALLCHRNVSPDLNLKVEPGWFPCGRLCIPSALSTTCNFSCCLKPHYNWPSFLFPVPLLQALQLCFCCTLSAPAVFFWLTRLSSSPLSWIWCLIYCAVYASRGIDTSLSEQGDTVNCTCLFQLSADPIYLMWLSVLAQDCFMKLCVWYIAIVLECSLAMRVFVGCLNLFHVKDNQIEKWLWSGRKKAVETPSFFSCCSFSLCILKHN